jgi:polar amino acid transport system substrate-binding protein
MEELAAAFPGIRVLADDFLVVGQAIVVPKGNRTRLEQVNRFVAEMRTSGFVKASIARAKLAGVQVAPAAN